MSSNAERLAKKTLARIDEITLAPEPDFANEDAVKQALARMTYDVKKVQTIDALYKSAYDLTEYALGRGSAKKKTQGNKPNEPDKPTEDQIRANLKRS
jgi:hypothetical protein